MLVLAVSALACNRASEVASFNVSQAADNFEVQRRVVFFNGITDKYLLTIEGRCSVTDQGNQLEVICKTGPNAYNKQFLGLSDDVSYFVEQLADVDASEYNYRVVYRPSVIVPDVEIPIGEQG